ncbi:methyltransferase [Streptomyces celluloflavus]
MTSSGNDTAPAGQPAALDPAQLAALCDIVSPMAIRVAATLRLPDLLADGPVPVARLAGASGTDPEALVRLLRLLTAKGLFTEPEPGTFATTAAAGFLTSEHPARMRDWLDLDGVGRMDLAYAGLLDAVRTGTPVYERIVGRPVWADAAQDPGFGAAFDGLMETMAAHWAPAVTAAHDWSGVTHVVDVGGSTGSLLLNLLAERPALRGTLVELPVTAVRARERIAASDVRERCAVREGSFFDPLPEGADRYVLAHVLHNWGDEDAVRILRRCAEAAGPTGRVLVVERLLGDEAAGYPDATVDLSMLVTFGGRERTPDHYGELAGRAGLVHATTRPLGSGASLVEYVAAGRAA